jgi:prolyl oligopeptidase PreP (S9A serine peptidase family)
MDWTTLIIQLGISGLVLYVAFRIFMKLIDHQAKADSERTIAMAKAESERTQAIREGFAADVAAHNSITMVMQKMQNQNYRMEAKLDTVLDLTPVRGILRERADSDEQVPVKKTPPPSVIVNMNELDDDDDTPVDRPEQTPRTPTQPRASSVAGVYGPKKPG